MFPPSGGFASPWSGPPCACALDALRPGCIVIGGSVNVAQSGGGEGKSIRGEGNGMVGKEGGRRLKYLD